MIREVYGTGKQLTDGEGVLWKIVKTWEYRNYWCMQVVGVNNLEISGGTRVRIDDTGGMALAVR